MRRDTGGGCRIIRFAPLAAFVLAAGCSSSGGTGGSSFGDRFTQAMASGSAPAPAVTTGAATNLSTCPNVDIRQGAGSVAINTAPRDPTAMQLRYQVSVAQTARECANVA